MNNEFMMTKENPEPRVTLPLITEAIEVLLEVARLGVWHSLRRCSDESLKLDLKLEKCGPDDDYTGQREVLREERNWYRHLENRLTEQLERLQAIKKEEAE